MLDTSVEGLSNKILLLLPYVVALLMSLEAVSAGGEPRFVVKGDMLEVKIPLSGFWNCMVGSGE